MLQGAGMKILFIRPSLGGRQASDAMEPLCFAILKSLTPPEVETELVDERIEPVQFDRPADLVAMTVETFTARRAYQIAAAYRSSGVPVVMGGFHPTFVPDEALAHADSVVMGDAEGLWHQVVADAAHGELRPVYRQQAPPELAGIPDRRLFAGKRYARLSMIQLGRGCRHSCEFCSIRAFYGSHLRHREVAEVIAEIEQAGHRHVVFVDDNLLSYDGAVLRQLVAALAGIGVRWTCQISLEVARDRSLVRQMAASGCAVAAIGFESLNEHNLHQMGKAWSAGRKKQETAIKVLQDAGIMIYGTFVFGYDHDTADSFARAVEFAVRHRFMLANFNPLTPTPGTPLFERLRRQGRLLHERWWLDPDYRYGDALFRPVGMTAAELSSGCLWARRQFSGYGSILKRLWDPACKLSSPFRVGLHLQTNLVSRREIVAKQGLALAGEPCASP